MREFVEELTRLPGMADTLFVFSSDHGEGLADHPEIVGGYFHGFLLYESHVWVPLVLYHARGEVGPRVVERPVRNMDLMPTLLDLLGLSPPEGLNGVSVAPLLEAPGAKVGLPKYFVTETEFRVSEKIGVYAEEWKYFENRDAWSGVNPRELQPVGESESGERSDRLEDRPGVARALDDYLDRWESEHPKSPPVTSGGPSPEERRRLQELGYLE